LQRSLEEALRELQCGSDRLALENEALSARVNTLQCEAEAV
jgi:hypothetical protein